MGRYSTLTNQSITIDAAYDFLDSGWSVSGGAAIHESCNSGFITNTGFVTEPGHQYKIEYTVSHYESGEVHAVMGGTDGVSRTADGKYIEVITAADNTGVKFWSDGDLWVTGVRISDGVVGGTTLVFNEKYLQWTGERSYIPEFATKFLDSVLLFRDGQTWLQEASETRNNFFGEQYNSVIEFYVNIDYTTIKTLYSMRQNGNLPWDVTEVSIPPRVGKSKGQLSRIKSGNFKRLQGQWFADFLRDLNDPRFNTEQEKLRKGAVLQGEIAKIRIESDGTGEMRLVSIDILGAKSEYSY